MPQISPRPGEEYKLKVGQNPSSPWKVNIDAGVPDGAKVTIQKNGHKWTAQVKKADSAIVFTGTPTVSNPPNQSPKTITVQGNKPGDFPIIIES